MFKSKKNLIIGLSILVFGTIPFSLFVDYMGWSPLVAFVGGFPIGIIALAVATS